MSDGGSAGGANEDAFVYRGEDGPPIPRRATRVRVHASVAAVPPRAFHGLPDLTEAELPAGRLRRIGAAAFRDCPSLRRVAVPSSVVEVGVGAFEGCRALAEAELPEGIEVVGRNAFRGCVSLERIVVPSSVGTIEWGTFCGCEGLSEVVLRAGLTKIERHAFYGCTSLVRVTIPPSVKDIGDSAFQGCAGLVAAELCGGLKVIGDRAFIECRLLRSVAVPRACGVGLSAFTFPTISRALVHRFDKWPVHRICYFQQSHPPNVALQRAIAAIDSAKEMNDGTQQDCLGMTPLHITVCSSRHDLEFYRIVIKAFPTSLVTRDDLGIPILYAFWLGAPKDVVQLMAESHKTHFPDNVLDWEGMVTTLGEANAPKGIQNLFNANKQYFSDQSIDWEGSALELARPNGTCTPKTLQFVLRLATADRLKALGVEKWRREAERFIDGIPRAVGLLRRVLNRKKERLARSLFSALSSCEQLKEAAWLLELATWKTSIDDFESVNGRPLSGEERFQCRISCGAQEIVPNVICFLMPTWQIQ